MTIFNLEDTENQDTIIGLVKLRNGDDVVCTIHPGDMDDDNIKINLYHPLKIVFDLQQNDLGITKYIPFSKGMVSIPVFKEDVLYVSDKMDDLLYKNYIGYLDYINKENVNESRVEVDSYVDTESGNNDIKFPTHYGSSEYN